MHAASIRRTIRHYRLAALGAMAIVSATALAEGTTSEGTFVFVNAGASFFWHTATNNVLTLPVFLPKGATSATLAVTGIRHSFTATGIGGGDYELTLPAATSPQSENVYSLALTFDDEAATTWTATLGLVTAYGTGGEGRTRLLAPAGTPQWGRVEQLAVIPIPSGATSLSIDGVEADTGLGGDAGWHALPVPAGRSRRLSMADADGGIWTAALTGTSPTLITFK